MSTVHAPYHFVPLSKWVYMPDWAHLVSHDHPFEDGHSGVIEYTLTNHTPLCVGGEKVSGLVKFARDPQGNPIIPSTSIKGMIRSVLEIASFGKFNQIDDKRFSYRDISSNKSHYVADIIIPNTVQAGWIKFDEVKKDWFFTSCNAVKVAHKEIKQALGKSISNHQSAILGYQSIPLSLGVDARISEEKGKQENENRWAEALSFGGQGSLVFTNTRIPRKGKTEFYEFSYYFYPQTTPSYRKVTEQVNHLFTNHTSIKEIIDGVEFNQVSYLKKYQHPERGIPVFALIKKNGASKGQIHSLGFAKMPRVSYEHSTHDLVKNLSNAHMSDGYFDLAELMFGTLRDEGLSLKSRVAFSDAVSEHCCSAMLYQSNPLILAEPKASFYPAYLEQNQQQRQYHDYDTKASLSGHKRYIAKMTTNPKLDSNILVKQDKQQNINIQQQLELAPIGSTFTGRVVFNNLKSVELSALIWCMKLPSSYHQLGHGKPLGAGVVSIDCKVAVLNSNSHQFDEAQAGFVEHMESNFPIEQQDAWIQSPQIQYLLNIGRLGENESIDTRYMSIDNKDYQYAKNSFAKLPDLHAISRIQVMSEGTATSFGRGRLANLIDCGNPWNVEQMENAKKIQQQRDDKKTQQQKAQALAEYKASLTIHANNIMDLKANLEWVDYTNRAPLIRESISFFLQNIDTKEAESAQQLYLLARQYDYHQKPKKRAKEQKVELNNLKIQYELTV